MPQEDWQLSQFWYSPETAETLAKEALAAAGEGGSIACISCPTLYHRLREVKPDHVKAVILEFDQRFSKYGEDFICYDYNTPLKLDSGYEHAFDVVFADPPFLSEECISKTVKTIKFLAKSKIIVCTGATMEEFLVNLLGLHKCKFTPKHEHNLANEFMCYANFETMFL